MTRLIPLIGVAAVLGGCSLSHEDETTPSSSESVATPTPAPSPPPPSFHAPDGWNCAISTHAAWRNQTSWARTIVVESSEQVSAEGEYLREYAVVPSVESPTRVGRVWALPELGQPDGAFVALLDSGDQVFMWAPLNDWVVHFADERADPR